MAAVGIANQKTQLVAVAVAGFLAGITFGGVGMKSHAVWAKFNAVAEAQNFGGHAQFMRLRNDVGHAQFRRQPRIIPEGKAAARTKNRGTRDGAVGIPPRIVPRQTRSWVVHFEADHTECRVGLKGAHGFFDAIGRGKTVIIKAENIFSGRFCERQIQTGATDIADGINQFDGNGKFAQAFRERR